MANLEMTHEEIYRRYERADKKAAQIKILAELNACPVDVIKDIINEEARRVKKRPGRPKKAPPASMGKAAERPPDVVTDAVKGRMDYLEQRADDLIRATKDLQDKLKEITDEWGKLKEWMTQYDIDPAESR